VDADKLKKFLNEQSYDYDEVVRRWKERGWLAVDNEKGKHRLTKKVNMGSDAPRLVVIRRSAFDQLEESAPAPEADPPVSALGAKRKASSLNLESFIDD
jgi:hypothetical protein